LNSKTTLKCASNQLFCIIRDTKCAGSKLYGDLIDEAVRNTQDKQTLGIPVGPLTSDLISELLGTSLNIKLSNVRSGLKGLRYVDDYYRYFAARSEAESALAACTRLANHFVVELNPLKTRISELPESIQPSWKSEPRSHVMRQSTRLSQLFRLALRPFVSLKLRQ